MKILYYLLCSLLLALFNLAHCQERLLFRSKISAIPQNVALKMHQHTWHKGCPVSIEHLAYVTLSYWGFDNQPHTGALIVNHELAPQVVSIFKALYQQHFPIQHMELMDAYQGNDNASMAANNTSAFNCRAVTNRPGEYSQHSYGRAIDLNPLLNPYVQGENILPSAGALYVDRGKPVPGKIVKDDLVYRTFIKYGWDWAGNWHDLQDYQHFEKRAHGKKREPTQ